MPLKFVFDEHFRGRLIRAVRRHAVTSGLPIDVTEVGEPVELPTGTLDPALLAWAAANDRIVVSGDRNTLIADFYWRLAAGQSSPGLLIVAERFAVADLIEVLELAAYAGTPDDFTNRVRFVP